MSRNMKGRIPWNKGKKNCFSADTIKKMSNSLKGRVSWNAGKKDVYSKQTLKLMSEIKKENPPMYWLGKKMPPMPESWWNSRCGERSALWKGGISAEPYSKEWNNRLKRVIRDRDNHKCQVCRKKQPDRKLDVHHIDYNKKNCLTSNLISLCKSCHIKTNSRREYWEKYFKNNFKL